MCRWLAYTGAPILLSRALYAPAHSLIDQSLHSRLGAEPTNGDGFGVGWYDDAGPEPGRFPDSEVLFYLALSLGLTDDPPSAVAKTIGLVESAGHALGVAEPFQGTLAVTDGERMWVFRYSNVGESRSLFYTADIPTLRQLYPRQEIFDEVSDDARLVVSEPIGDLPGAWREMPESSYAVIAGGRDDVYPFAPTPPPSSQGPAAG